MALHNCVLTKVRQAFTNLTVLKDFKRFHNLEPLTNLLNGRGSGGMVWHNVLGLCAFATLFHLNKRGIHKLDSSHSKNLVKFQKFCCVALKSDFFILGSVGRIFWNLEQVLMISRPHSLLKGWNNVSSVVFEDQIRI